MKTTFRTSFYAVSICFLFNPAFSQIETSQYDDIYFDGTETVIKKNKTDKQSLNSDNVEIFEDEYSETEVVEEETYVEKYIESIKLTLGTPIVKAIYETAIINEDIGICYSLSVELVNNCKFGVILKDAQTDSVCEQLDDDEDIEDCKQTFADLH